MNYALMEKVQKAIAEIRPNLQADGGDIELVGVEDGTIKVRLKGACAGCPMSTMTVKWASKTTCGKRYQKSLKLRLSKKH